MSKKLKILLASKSIGVGELMKKKREEILDERFDTERKKIITEKKILSKKSGVLKLACPNL